MHSPPRILIVEDDEASRDILEARLEHERYDIVSARNGQQGVDMAMQAKPDVILLDIMMPKMDGFEVCRTLRSTDIAYIPIIMLTAKSEFTDVIAGLEAGADEYLSKPVDHASLIARVKSMLRIKELYDEVLAQRVKLQQQANELEKWNEKLQEKVNHQVQELEQIRSLKRFFSPQLVNGLTSADGHLLLKSHRREITVVFSDLRGFTHFTQSAEPEEVMEILSQHHSAMGEIIFEHEGTLERFAGDGIIVFFNDSIPRSDHTAQAVRMADKMRSRMIDLSASWKRDGYALGFGVGIARGYATLGMIGFESRIEYTAIGSVVNLASRLSDKAQDGEILISQRAMGAVETIVDASPVEELSLKGFLKSEHVYRIENVHSTSPKIS